MILEQYSNHNARLNISIYWRTMWVSISSLEFIVGLILSSLAINLLGLVMPLVLLQIYDRVIPNAAFETLFLLFILVSVAILAEAFLSVTRSLITAWLDARLEHRLSQDSFHSILNTSLRSFEQRGPGVHLERLSSLGPLKDFYSGQALSSLLDLPFLLLYFTLITYLAGILVLIPLIVFMMHISVAIFYSYKIKDDFDNLQGVDDSRINFIIELITGIHIVKTFSMESQILRRYERLQDHAGSINQKIGIQSGYIFASNQFFSQLALIGTVSAGGILVLQGQLTAGTLAACTLLVGRILQPANKMIAVWKRFQNILISEKRIQEIENLPDESSCIDKHFPIVYGKIKLEQLTYHDISSPDPLFSNLDAQINPGSIAAITGPAASGKTTLLSLMFGLDRPTSGQIKVDGYNIHQYDLHTYRQQVTFLHTHASLFRGTILENITMFEVDKYRKRALKIADELGLTDAIRCMPKGFNTVVGYQAVDMLPKGLRQRIAIVRALVRNPKIIFFDESNIGIDIISDNLIKDFIKHLRGSCTMVLVTHRPSFLDLADQKFRLFEGNLLEL